MSLSQEERGAVRPVRAVRDRPIIFSAPMVRALLDGRKTQTRRIVKRPMDHFHGSYTHVHQDGAGFVWSDGKGGCQRVAKVSGAAGDRLWVRETWQTGSGYEGPQVAYRATDDAHDIDAWDGEDEGAGPSFNYDRLPGLKWHTWLPDLLSGTDGSWRSPIHMPRALSRLTLIVEAVKVERLQDISEEDCDAEVFGGDFPHAVMPELFSEADGALTIKECFAKFWNSIHGPEAWAANPWVCALTFRAIPQNIDSLRDTPSTNAPTGDQPHGGGL